MTTSDDEYRYEIDGNGDVINTATTGSDSDHWGRRVLAAVATAALIGALPSIPGMGPITGPVILLLTSGILLSYGLAIAVMVKALYVAEHFSIPSITGVILAGTGVAAANIMLTDIPPVHARAVFVAVMIVVTVYLFELNGWL